MDTSIFLAQAWGLYLVIVVLCMWLRPSNVKRWLHLAEDASMMWIAGAMSLVLGLLSVLSHNVWSDDWRLLITLLGWMALIKGITRLMWPDSVAKMALTMGQKKALVATSLIVCFVIGLYLMYQGFWA